MELKKLGLFLAVVTLAVALVLNWNSIAGVDLPGRTSTYVVVLGW